MPTINENIAELQQKTTDLITAHTDIKNAIIAKGGTVNDGDKFSDYPEDIATIKNELTSISINENGTYKNGTLDTVTGAEYPIEIVANGEPIVSMTVDGNTVQDGTPAPTAPVDAIGVGIKSENLFDATGVAKGRINSSTGAMEYAEDTPTLTYSDTNNEFTITTRYAWRGFVTEYLDLQEKPVFSYISDDGTFYAFSYAYDINKNYLGAITSTAPTGTKYIRVSIQCSTILTNAKIKNIMLNEGRERLPYEPYGYYLPTSINGGNDINAYFGNYQTTRKIKKLVLTGEETCSATKISNNLYCFSFKYSNVGMTDILDYDVDMRTIPYPQFISSHFKMKAAPTVFPDEYGNINDGEIGANSVRTQDVPSSQVTYNRYFILCAAGYTSTTEFKNWLTAQYQAGTPVTIWYILATPQTTTSSEPLMKIGDYADQLTLTDSDITLPTVTGNNLVDYDLTVKPSSASISYYKLGVNKTITSDTLPIEFESTGDNAALLLQGNTTQNDTPTPDNPIQPQGCGDMSSNLWSYHPDTTSGGVRLLWDGEKINYSNTCTYASNSTMTINLKKGTYTLKVNANRIPVENDYSCIDIYHPSSGLLKQVTNRNAVNGKVTFTIDDDLSNASLRIRLDNGTNYDGFEIRPMLNIGETSLPYDVYGQYKIPISSGSTTTPIYLGEVQSTRQIKKLVLDGTEHWVYRQGEPSNVFFLETIDVNVVDNHGLCTHYLNQDSGGFDVLQDKHVLIKLSSTGTKWFLGVRDSDFGLPDFKAYLAAQYTAGTPVTIWYVLATEETGIVNEPLMRIGDYADTLSSVQAQVQIPTTVGHNTFNVNTTVKPSSTSITYNDLNTIGYNEINVDVPNTYTVEDEGKVVNNATLVAQTAMPTEITANDTYDTTLYNSIIVNVPDIVGHTFIVATIPNAVVTVTNASNTYTETADNVGEALFKSVAAGTYNVTATYDDAVSDTTSITIADHTVTEDTFAKLTISASDNTTITVTDGTVTKTLTYTGTPIVQYVSLGTWDLSCVIDDTEITRTVLVNSYTNQNIRLAPPSPPSQVISRYVDFTTNTTTITGDPNTHPVYMNINRCNVSDNGTINAYYGDASYVEDGSNGQVMVKIPKFYYKVTPDENGGLNGANIRKCTWEISETPADGFTLHPAFYDANGNEIDYFLYGAFDGVGQRDSTYGTSYNTSTDKLSSVAGSSYLPTNSLTRATARTMATNRGTGWYSAGVKQTMAVLMLFAVEYGFNSQIAVGQGVVSASAAVYAGQTTGNITSGTQDNKTTPVNWRGIENLWGNIWDWIDGLNVNERIPYFCNTYTFVDDTSTGYTQISFSLPSSNYITAFGYDSTNDWVLLPSESSSTANPSGPIGDYVYSNSGWRVARLGGHWNFGSYAGAFYWNCNYASSDAAASIGARLMFIPTAA